MVKPTRPPANAFISAIRKVYNPLGFGKGYNFVLWFITIGYLFGFTLARLQYLSFHGIFCNPDPTKAGAAPGECYYWLQNPFKIAMMIHLFTILPAAFLVCFQFVPAIRHKVRLFHRINGYVVVLLSLTANAAAIVIAPHAFGGDLATQTYVGAAVISTTISYAIAWVNIKRLQIDQHRAWMMRTWAYFASIITIRLIQLSVAAIISHLNGYYVTKPCAVINSVIGPEGTLAYYPEWYDTLNMISHEISADRTQQNVSQPFFDGTNLYERVIVKATNYSEDPLEISAAAGIGFGAAGWVALWLHAIAIEVYLRLTPAESERLRQVSYERQIERGFKNPGSAGLVAQRLGDANPYVPRSQ
ncbi:hypothetical protein LTR37_019350 [Vermiconidia calcicola]|uniref:Uncharacterized protein n=1 Tax=Vermiconidia calcicola TaxID=1690605 RepID=A0ACC3MEE6_9PEZI|nr:hypothetical protein LTR37_019350 [Vermiconidia calcicola]